MKKTLIGALLAATTLASTAHAGITENFQNLTGYTKTKHPIMLVHGFLGFQKLNFGVASVNYFYGIPTALTDAGANVHIANMSAFNSTEVRGEQLRAQIEEVLAITGKPKINLIGHSQGGPTVRYAAAVLPGKVASITTIAGTHLGSKVADDVLAADAKDPNTVKSLSSLADFGGAIIGFLSGKDNLDEELRPALQSLSTVGQAAFNTKYPLGMPTTACGQGPSTAGGMKLYSWSGTSVKTNALDVSDLIIASSAKSFGTEPNDGIVSRCSSHFGQVLRDDYPQNHLDEINQVLGAIGQGTGADPVPLYRAHANRLKKAGL
ncbi:MAG: triacylglycerol lipase [Moraxellaceae bacterium]